MNNKATKYIEIIAGSTVLFAVAGYFCGYSIMSSFLRNMFDLPFTAGITFPPLNIILLGYFVIFSFAVAVILFWDFSVKRDMSEVLTLIIVFLGISLIDKISISFDLYGFQISSSVVKIFTGIFFLIALFFGFVLIIKGKNKLKKVIDFFSDKFPLSVIAIFFAIFLPFFSQLRGVSVSGSYFNPLSFMVTFYAEFLYVLIILSVVISVVLKYFKSRKKNKQAHLVILKTFIVCLALIYSFSVVIGRSLAEEYIKNNSGVFPLANILLKEKVKINGKEQKKINDIGFLTKDSNSYYFFLLNPRRLFSISSENIISIELHK